MLCLYTYTRYVYPALFDCPPFGGLLCSKHSCESTNDERVPIALGNTIDRLANDLRCTDA